MLTERRQTRRACERHAVLRSSNCWWSSPSSASSSLCCCPPSTRPARPAAELKCQNQLKQISLAMINYENNRGGFPSMAMGWVNHPLHLNTPGSWYDDHGWYSQIGDFLEQKGWSNWINLSVSLSNVSNAMPRQYMNRHSSPAQRPRAAAQRVDQRELGTYSRQLRGQRGQYQLWTVNPWQRAIPWRPVHLHQQDPAEQDRQRPCPYADDVGSARVAGASLTGRRRLGRPALDLETALGGQTFNGYNPPNSPVGDMVARMVQPNDFYTSAQIPIPQALPGSADDQTIAQTFAARSRHPGGVVASYCDGSVCFTADSIDPLVWRALTTAWGKEVVMDPNKQ